MACSASHLSLQDWQPSPKYTSPLMHIVSDKCITGTDIRAATMEPETRA